VINNKFYSVEHVDDDMYSIKELKGHVVHESLDIDTLHNRLDKLENILSEILSLSKAIRERQVDIQKGWQ
jgi:hypothetical protein